MIIIIWMKIGKFCKCLKGGSVAQHCVDFSCFLPSKRRTRQGDTPSVGPSLTQHQRLNRLSYFYEIWCRGSGQKAAPPVPVSLLWSLLTTFHEFLEERRDFRWCVLVHCCSVDVAYSFLPYYSLSYILLHLSMILLTDWRSILYSAGQCAFSFRKCCPIQ
jgi:hypothetical protein